MSASFPDSSIPAPAPRRSRHSLIVVILLVALGALAWQQLPDGRLHVFFPATRGDAMVIVTPRGGLVLVDGGNDPTTLTTALGRRLPFWRRDLDAVILTRTESRFVRGQVAALERYAPRMAILPTGRHTSTLLREWRRLLEAHRARLVTVETTRQLVIDGVMIRFFPTSSGLLVRLDYGGTRV
ncbi:MAG TPA: hypothetical protein PKA05_03845, partial [Roseiflexaceae bacterium]|nr:hypothetical protein [Roseiflexaceae bacterium]